MGRASRAKAERRASDGLGAVLDELEQRTLLCERIFGPGCWDEIDALIAKGRGTDWPENILLPNGYAYLWGMARTSASGAVRGPLLHIPERLSLLHSMALWRFGKGVYRVDENLAQALMDTTPSAGIPATALDNLPEWGCFVVAPRCWDGPYIGFFASGNLDDERGEPALRILLIEPDGRPSDAMYDICFDKSSVDAQFDDEVARETEELAALGLDEGLVRESAMAGRHFAELALGLTLYLCATNSDVRRAGSPAGPARAKKADLTVQPDIRKWEAGYRIGPLLATRRASGATHGPDDGAARAPHLRRAHWHHYWTGPRESDQRDLILHWVHPTLVGGKADIPRVRDL